MIFSPAAATEESTASVNLSGLASTASMSGSSVSNSSAGQGPGFGGSLSSQPASRSNCKAAAPTSFMVRAVMRTFQDTAAKSSGSRPMCKRGVALHRWPHAHRRLKDHDERPQQEADNDVHHAEDTEGCDTGLLHGALCSRSVETLWPECGLERVSVPVLRWGCLTGAHSSHAFKGLADQQGTSHNNWLVNVL